MTGDLRGIIRTSDEICTWEFETQDQRLGKGQKLKLGTRELVMTVKVKDSPELWGLRGLGYL